MIALRSLTTYAHVIRGVSQFFACIVFGSAEEGPRVDIQHNLAWACRCRIKQANFKQMSCIFRYLHYSTRTRYGSLPLVNHLFIRLHVEIWLHCMVWNDSSLHLKFEFSVNIDMSSQTKSMAVDGTAKIADVTCKGFADERVQKTLGLAQIISSSGQERHDRGTSLDT